MWKSRIDLMKTEWRGYYFITCTRQTLNESSPAIVIAQENSEQAREIPPKKNFPQPRNRESAMAKVVRSLDNSWNLGRKDGPGWNPETRNGFARLLARHRCILVRLSVVLSQHEPPAMKGESSRLWNLQVVEDFSRVPALIGLEWASPAHVCISAGTDHRLLRRIITTSNGGLRDNRCIQALPVVAFLPSILSTYANVTPRK